MDKNITKIALRGVEEGSTTNYRLQTVWWTPAAIEQIWETLASYAAWPTWWRGIQSVEVLRRGDESGVGTVLRQGWRSRLPYTLVFDLEMLRIESRRLLEGRASGDLEGTCRWTFTPVNGGTEIRFDVNVRTGRWWMNLPFPFAPRVVRANFETIMRWGREGWNGNLVCLSSCARHAHNGGLLICADFVRSSPTANRRASPMMRPFNTEGVIVRSLLRRHSLTIGLALMFLYTWTVDRSNSGVLPFRVPFFFALTLGWGLVIVAVLMTWLTLGQDAMVSLLKRYLLWRVDWKGWMVAFLLLPALRFASVLLISWLTRVPADFSHPMIRDIVPLDAPLLGLVIPWFIFEVLTNGEEMGWRGYVLPRLQAKYSALVASLIVGVIWSVWHLPKFLGTGLSGERSFLWFTIAPLALAVLYTWLYNNTRGSLLLVVLFHATANNAGVFLPVQFAVPGGMMENLMIVLYVVAAVVVTLYAGAKRLSRTKEKQVEATEASQYREIQVASQAS